ncbi:MAG: FecR domain-containing protein [Verrucomicrobiota bacterium]
MKPSSTPISESNREIELAASRWIGRRDAGMTAAEQREFEAWRRADPCHAQAFARHEATWQRFDRPAGAGKAEELIAALEQSQARRRSRRRASTVVVSCLVLASALSLVWQRTATTTPALAPRLAETRPNGGAVVVVPEKRTLPDGSIVELKRGADLVVEFTAATRRVELKQGEALFQVIKDPSRPFIVSAGGVAVRAVGTAFSVQFERNEVGVLVTEGHVAVETAAPALSASSSSFTPSAAPSGTATPATTPTSASAPTPASVSAATPTPASTPAPAADTTLHLTAGQRTVVVPAAATAPLIQSLSAADLAAQLAWRSPRLEFTSTPLQEAIELFNRYAADSGSPRLVIEPADDSLAQLEVSGFFRANNVPAFLHLISQTLGVTAEPQGDRIALRRAR